MNKEEGIKRRHALKDTIKHYYAEEMLMTLLKNKFTETEICTELKNMMKRISKEKERPRNDLMYPVILI